METYGNSLRARGLGPLGPQSRKACLRNHTLLSSGHLLRRRLRATPGSGADPAAGPPLDANDSLAPVVYRFADSTSSPGPNTASAGPSSQGAAWTGVLSSSGSSASMVPVDASPGISADLTAPSNVGAPPSSRPAHDGGSGDIPILHTPDSGASYSEFYRKANTVFTRSHLSGTVANGWSHSSSRTPAAPSHAAPSGLPVSQSAPALDLPSSVSGAADSSSPLLDSEATSNGAGADGKAQPAGDQSAGADTAEVAAAIARAQAALERAEASLDDIQRVNSDINAAALESLRLGAPPSRWSRVVAAVRSAALLGSLTFAMLASHAFGLAVQWAGATLGAAMIAGWGLRRGALAPSGAAAAFVVGCGTLGSSLRFGATLIAFFLSSSKLTSYKEELKEGLEENAKKGGQRTWLQVLCNGLVPTILAVVYGILAGCVDLPLGPPGATAAADAASVVAGPALEPWRAAALTGLMGGFLGYYACCCGDTWASELGPLSADTPRLITTMRPVRRGTNGGVTLLGLSASIMGGMFVGLVFYLAGLLSPTLWIFESQRALAAGQWRLIPLGLMAGLFGSVLDSVLGATLQYSGYDTQTGRIVSRPGPDVKHIAGWSLLDNNAVNALSATVTSALTAFVALKTFGF